MNLLVLAHHEVLIAVEYLAVAGTGFAIFVKSWWRGRS